MNQLTTNQKISTFLSAMSMENSLLQSYRALFMAIEGALIASTITLIKLFEGSGIVWVGLAGLVIGIMWIIVCDAKGKDVDRWRNLLLKEAKKAHMYPYFSFMKSGFSLAGGRIARYWFNWIMPILIIVFFILLMVHTYL